MKETLDSLRFLINHTRMTFSYYTATDVNTMQFFCLCMIERLHAACEGLINLVEGVEANIYLEYSAGLIIRTELLDFLIALKAYDIQCQLYDKDNLKSKDEVEKEITEYCEGILADGLNLTFGYAKDLAEANIISENELHQAYRTISKKYSRYIHEYKEDGNKPDVKYKIKVGGKLLFKHLAQRPFLKDLARVYDTYLYYSRYEHFSVLSQEVLREEANEKLGRLHKAIYRLTVFNFILCDILASFDIDNKFINRQCIIAGEYVETNRLV